MHPTAGIRPPFLLPLLPLPLRPPLLLPLLRATLPFAAHYHYTPRPDTEELEKWRLRLRRRIPTVDGPLPYFVHRTATGNLPVYQEIKSGGNMHQTRIRKVEGDLRFLIRQIREALELGERDVKFNDLTSQIIIKGRQRERVLELFTYLRF